MRHLIDRHGAEAETLLSRSKKFKGFDEHQRLWLAELDHAVETTMCFSLVDFYRRRTPLMLNYSDHGLAFQEILGEHLGGVNEAGIKSKNELIDDLERHVAAELEWRTNP